MRFVCGNCGEVIAALVASRYCGGVMPHPECGHETEFAPAEHPNEPKALSVRKIGGYEEQAGEDSDPASPNAGLSVQQVVEIRDLFGGVHKDTAESSVSDEAAISRVMVKPTDNSGRPLPEPALVVPTKPRNTRKDRK